MTLNNSIRMIKTKYLYFLYFIVILAAHVFVQTGSKDDAWFGQMLAQYPLTDYLQLRYETWTSRLMIEGILVILAQCSPWIWKICNSLIFVLLTYGCYTLFGRKKCLSDLLLLMFLSLLFPARMLSSAGWIATTTNYLWPISVGLYALVVLKKMESNEAFHLWEYPLFFLALLFASSQEQMAAVLLASYLLYGGYRLYNRKKLPVFWWIQVITIIGCIIFILSCPGNNARKLAETASFFPEFDTLSGPEKLLLGILVTGSYYIGCDEYNIVFLMFTGILALYMLFSKEHSLYKKIIALMPFAFSALLGFLGRFFMNFRPDSLWLMLLNNDRLSSFGNFSTYHIIVECFMFLFILICVILTLYFIYGKSNLFLLNFVILGAALCSRIIMGFSPSVYASGSRTATIGYLCFLILSFLGVTKASETILYKKFLRVFAPCMLIAVILHFGGSILFYMATI